MKGMNGRKHERQILKCVNPAMYSQAIGNIMKTNDEALLQQIYSFFCKP